jgi:protocatechuate 3,4-dioxygenase beta subunit
MAAARFMALAALLTGIGATALDAQVATGTLQGHVRDTAGRPIRNARVIIVGTSFSAPTDSTGSYRIEKIPPGMFALRATYVGYTPMGAEGIRILAGQLLQRDFMLKVSAVTMQDVVVTESAQKRLVGRRHSGAKRPDPDDLEHRSASGR